MEQSGRIAPEQVEEIAKFLIIGDAIGYVTPRAHHYNEVLRILSPQMKVDADRITALQEENKRLREGMRVFANAWVVLLETLKEEAPDYFTSLFPYDLKQRFIAVLKYARNERSGKAGE